jgi:hypothetical protein
MPELEHLRNYDPWLPRGLVATAEERAERDARRAARHWELIEEKEKATRPQKLGVRT